MDEQIKADVQALREALEAQESCGNWSANSGHVHIPESEEWPMFDINLRPGRHKPVAVKLARYIAAASPDRISRLLDHVERLEQKRDALRTALEEILQMIDPFAGEMNQGQQIALLEIGRAALAQQAKESE